MTSTIRLLLPIISTFLFMLSTSSSAKMNYECWSYLNGSPDKMINVLADSREDAQRQAVPRLRDVGAKHPESAKCK